LQQVELPNGSVRRTFLSRLALNGGIEVSQSGRQFRVWEDDHGYGRGEVWSAVTGELVAQVPLCLLAREGCVLNPDETRMAIPGTDSLLRIWDLEQRRVLLTLPIQPLAWRWSSDGTKLWVLGSDLALAEFDGSPWKPGEAKAASIPFRHLIPARPNPERARATWF
jgi:WD40 repeat protein